MTRSKFDEQLRQLNDELLKMGNMIEVAIKNAIQAMLTQNVDLAKAIMAGDEQVDRQQKIIEGICYQLLIQQQPVAKDLRVITAAMKMVTDMERIGDQAADISELTVMMSDIPYMVNQDNIKAMSDEAMTMLTDALDAYVTKDMEKASSVIAADDIVDDLFIKVKGELIDIMKKYPEYEEYAADLLMVNKYLERVGDHATNIAEWVIFALETHKENSMDI